jgi:DNA invertase Pin-like site-specific DNA recombinase
VKKTAPIERIGCIYGRYSSHNQKDISIEQQVEKCRELALRSGITVVRVYADRAVSGKTDQRREFQRMMRDAEKGEFSHIIAWKSSRLGRNMLQAMVNEEKLNELGIKVVYVEENFGDNAAGRFALRSMMNVNQFYSENMAEDIKRGLMKNAENAMVNGELPFGYKRGEDGKYAIDEPKATIYREICDAILADVQYAELSKRLNARGIRTVRGNLWNKNSFHHMLRNENYIGVYHYSGVRIEDAIPPIISKEVFYKVQEKLSKGGAQGKYRKNADYLLTGKLFCGHCASGMVGISGKSKTGDVHHYYACQGRRLEHKCNKRNVRRDYIERAVAECIMQYVLKDDAKEWIAKTYVDYARQMSEKSELRETENALAEVKRGIKNVLDAIEQGIITPSTKERLTGLESERADLEIAVTLQKTALPNFTREKVMFWLDSFEGGDVEDKKFQAKLINSFVSAIYLFDDKLKIVFAYTENGRGKEVEFNIDDVLGDPEPAAPAAPVKSGFVQALLSPTNIGRQAQRAEMKFDWKVILCVRTSCRRFRKNWTSSTQNRNEICEITRAGASASGAWFCVEAALRLTVASAYKYAYRPFCQYFLLYRQTAQISRSRFRLVLSNRFLARIHIRTPVFH